MKNLLKVSVILFSISFGMATNSFAQEEEGERSILPFLKKGYRPQIGIAPVAGIQKTKSVSDIDFVYGVELSLQCPLYQCKKNHIRQQLSIVYTNRENYSSLAFELAPHYRLPIATAMKFGFGPHLGFQTNKVTILNNDYKANVFVIGAGASMSYDLGSFFVGADARYVWTTAADFSDNGSGSTLDNFRTIGKVGYRF